MDQEEDEDEVIRGIDRLAIPTEDREFLKKVRRDYNAEVVRHQSTDRTGDPPPNS
jgi:hypothetical protein